MKYQTSLLLFLLVALGGCIPDHWPQKWVNMAKPKPGAPEVPMPQWCYRTLARVDCYDAPQPTFNDRLVSEPAPRTLPQPEAKASLGAPEPLHTP